jgi:leader peptidase (prepilin peptidase)/N-methyltransferase
VAYAVVFLSGLIVGSFLNVCIYRIPRGISIISPSSRCPHCDSPVRVYDNIPLISYIFLRGRCRDCGGRISLRYPVVELLNGLCYLLVIWRYGIGLTGLVYMLYFSVLIVITFIDIDFQIIPDRITLPGSVVALLTGAFLLTDPFNRDSSLGVIQSLAGLILGGGMFYLIALISEMILKTEAMGGGDIKMMAMVGALTGWKGVLLTTFTGSLAGSFIGLGLMVFGGKGRRTKIPFGPFLAFGSSITVIWGEEFLRLYMEGLSLLL